MTDSNEAQNPTQAARREESPARLKRPLIRLAKACGVSTSYIDQLGAYVEIRDEVLVAVLASLGVDASNPAAVSKSLLETECRQREQLVPPTVLAITGRANNVPLRCSADALVALTLALEDGTAYAGDLRANLRVHKDADFGEQLELTLPDDLPIGYHTLNVQVGGVQRRATVIVAPPDFYNQLGQDWGQPPFSPQYLESTGYRVYREMVHNMFAHAGALRIDHVLGLFRLWWIPRGCTARDGAYVTYNHEVMLSILAIEASRANGVVIGEDLGTVPEYVSKVLAEHGVLGTAVEWFSRVDNSPNAGDPYAPPEDYRKYALASVTTHDLPPTAGYLKLEHVDLREELNLLNEPAEQFRAEVQAEIDQMLALLVSCGYLPQEVADGLKAACAPDADDAETADREALIQRVVEAMHVMLRDSPSVLVQAALVDGVGEHRTQNQPGTSWEYPNWRIPLADETGRVVHTEEVFDLPRVQSLAAALNR